MYFLHVTHMYVVIYYAVHMLCIREIRVLYHILHFFKYRRRSFALHNRFALMGGQIAQDCSRTRTFGNKCLVCLRREQQSTGYKQYKKRLVRPLLKAQERLYRRRNGTVQFSSSTPTTPPSPTDSPQSPVKATMYTQLNESNQPETVLAPSNSFKQRKYRHRRVGSGCGLSSSPRSSPHRERKVNI